MGRRGVGKILEFVFVVFLFLLPFLSFFFFLLFLVFVFFFSFFSCFFFFFFARVFARGSISRNQRQRVPVTQCAHLFVIS